MLAELVASLARNDLAIVAVEEHLDEDLALGIGLVAAGIDTR